MYEVFCVTLMCRVPFYILMRVYCCVSNTTRIVTRQYVFYKMQNDISFILTLNNAFVYYTFMILVA